MSAAAKPSLDQDQVAELLLDVIEAEPARRLILLAEIRGLSAAVADEVERLLACHEAAGIFLENSAALPADEPPVRALHSGEVLGERFLVEQFLGAGGFGEVYLALDMDLYRRVALKTIKPEYAAEPEFVSQLKQEIQIAQAVSHPNLCRLYDLERAQVRGADCVFLTMEWIAGPTLSTFVARGPVPEQAAFDIASQTLSGLAELHANHIVHRDLKTSNIMIAPESDGGMRVVITDFGLARIKLPGDVDTLSLLKSGWAIGTPAYMAPEQIRGKPASIASDLHAIGVTFFELRTGKLPFSGDSAWDVAMARLERDAPALQEFDRTISACWNNAVAACLERDPDRRPKSAAEVLALLSGARRRPTRRMLWTSALAAVMLSASGIVYHRWNSSTEQDFPLSATAKRSMQLGAMFLKDRSKQSLLSAVEEYSRVTREYSSYPAAWAGLAEAYSSLHGFGHMDTRESLARATEAGKRAVELDPENPRPAVVYARNLSINVQRWLEAEPFFQRALRGSADDPRLFSWYGAHLGRRARFDEAIALLERAVQQFPDDLSINLQLATEYFRSMRLKQFESTAREMVRLFFDKPVARLFLARALEWNRKFDEAETELAHAERLGWESEALPQKVTLAAARKRSALARTLAARARTLWDSGEMEAMQMAVAYLVTGEFMRAIDTLNSGFERQDSSVLYAPTNPYFVSVRKTPEFRNFARRLGLPD